LKDAPSTFDSNALFEAESKVRSGANWLVYLSALTIVCGTVEHVLLAEGAVYLALALLVRFRQSRAAVLMLFVASLLALALALLSLLAPSAPLSFLVGFAMPEVAFLVSLLTAIATFRFQRLLAAPLPPSVPSSRRSGAV